MNNNYLTVRQTADILDVSERTITRQIKTGNLSATKSDKGSWQIEKSEFYRVYPDQHPKTQADRKKNLEKVIKLMKHQAFEAKYGTAIGIFAAVAFVVLAVIFGSW